MADLSAPARPSSWWIGVALVAAVISLAAAVAAGVYQRNASRPIGEGQLFFEEAQLGLAQIDAALDAGNTPEMAVRQLRNALRIEAVALVEAEATVTAATSDGLLGTTITHPVLDFALEAGRFGAVAAPLDRDLEIDGVTKWEEGDTLYLALMPGGERAESLLLYYDVSELLSRRIRAQGVAPETVLLSLVSVFFAIAVLTALIGRSRSVQRYREMARESEFLRKESEALQAHNTELEAARSKAERALALAEETNRIRSEFVLMINHELRTPLTSVVTGAELLRLSGSLDPEGDEILGSLIHDGQRLQAMIDQLLALARVENRGHSFTPKRIPLGEACRAALDSHPGLSAEHHRSQDHDAEEDPLVATDLQTLTQLVASLVDNAFTHGATTVEVTCSTEIGKDPDLEVGETSDETAFISVIDDGPGIRKEFLPRAFEKFEKDSRSSGTGLGLYMARLMADAISARLMVWTSPNGTTISISLPLAGFLSRVGAA